jgi:tol-pal system protein YbgF
MTTCVAATGGRRGITLALVLALAALPATARAANREHQQLLAELRMLQDQNQQLALSVAALAEALKALHQRVDDQAAADRKVAADQRLAIDAVGADLRVVRERLDDTNVRLTRLAQELEAVRDSVPAALTAATPPAPSEATTPAGPGPAAAPPSPAPVPIPPSTAGLSPQRLYDTAYADFASGQWSMAIAGFETFIKSFPRSEQADQAQYYIGESLLLDGKFEAAVAAYDRVIANYPTGDQVPLAYYKRGIALLQLKQSDRARESWETVIKKYPDTDASRLAKQVLDRLARGGRP